MARATTVGLIVAAGLGMLLTTTLVFRVPPTLAGGQLNVPALILLLIALFMAVTGWAGLMALMMQRRWPGLAGRKGNPGIAAVRQGLLLAFALDAILVLAVAKILDLAIVLVILLLVGLSETFLQSRP